jgi:hypothetical protein
VQSCVCLQCWAWAAFLGGRAAVWLARLLVTGLVDLLMCAVSMALRVHEWGQCVSASRSLLLRLAAHKRAKRAERGACVRGRRAVPRSQAAACACYYCCCSCTRQTAACITSTITTIRVCHFHMCSTGLYLRHGRRPGSKWASCLHQREHPVRGVPCISPTFAGATTHRPMMRLSRQRHCACACMWRVLCVVGHGVSTLAGHWTVPSLVSSDLACWHRYFAS